MKIIEIICENFLLEASEKKLKALANKYAGDFKERIENDPRERQEVQNREISLELSDESFANVAKEILKILVNFDPTITSIYLEWLASRYIKSDFRLEDKESVKDALHKFNTYKKKLDKKDINQYNGYREISNAVKKLVQADAPTSKRHQRRREKQGYITPADVELVIPGENYRVESPQTQAAMNNLAWKDCDVEGNTDKEDMRWCTLTGKGGRFDQYNKDGKLYQITVTQGNRVRKFLVHYESGQFMDENDLDIKDNKKDIALLSQFDEHRQFLNMLVKKHYSEYFSES